MSGLFRNMSESREGKYPLLFRRDGTIPEWEWFVLGARDPGAPTAVRAYAFECKARNLDPAYVADLRNMADCWERFQQAEITSPNPPAKKADPDGPRHRKDDPEVLKFKGTLSEYKARIRREALEEAARLCDDFASEESNEPALLARLIRDLDTPKAVR